MILKNNRKLQHLNQCGERESCSVMYDSLQPHELFSPWNSLGQNTGVGSLSLLQGIFQPRDQTQVYRIAGGFFTSRATREAQAFAGAGVGVRLAYPFSGGSSSPRNQTGVSYFADRFFTNWDIREAHQCGTGTQINSQNNETVVEVQKSTQVKMCF